MDEDKAILVIERIMELSLRKKKLEERINKLRTALKDYMDENDLTSFLGAQMQERVSIEITDLEDFLAAVIQNKRYELISSTVPIGAYRQYISDLKQPPPGVREKKSRVLYVKS